MSSLSRPRGRLPARVYWVRRLLVLGTALALVVGIGSLLRRGSDASSGPDDQAYPAAAEESQTTPAASDSSTPVKQRRHQGRSHRPHKTPLPKPDGPCEASDVAIQPVVKHAMGGGPVTIRLKLGTRTSPACAWQLSADSMTFKITSGSDNIWSSLDCPRAVGTKDLVLRQKTPTWAEVTWSSRRSAPGCPGQQDWALPGYYHVAVAAFDGEPADQQFYLGKRTPETITPSPHGATFAPYKSGDDD